MDEAYQLDPSNSVMREDKYWRCSSRRWMRGRVHLLSCSRAPRRRWTCSCRRRLVLSSRVRRTVDFPDFSDDELVEVSQRKFASRFGNYELADEKYLRIAARRLGKGRGAPGFGNARAVSHLIDNAWEKQTRRVAHRAVQRAETRTRSTSRGKIYWEIGPWTCPSPNRFTSSSRQMEGFERVKANVDDLLRVVETNNEREDNEEKPQQLSLNKVFLGNPGTGKTTVARLYGRILNELGFLSRGDVVLATPSDFVGSALGQSEEKTNALLDKARGCVLVIDEAYGLDPSSGNGNGAIAGGDPFRGAVVDALVSRVQGEAGADVCVLLLGYERPMREFLRKANPGLARRFDLENAFVFDDYDDQALLKILLQNVRKRSLKVSLSDAKAAVRKRLAKQRLRPNFGNAGPPRR